MLIRATLINDGRHVWLVHRAILVVIIAYVLWQLWQVQKQTDVWTIGPAIGSPACLRLQQLQLLQASWALALICELSSRRTSIRLLSQYFIDTLSVGIKYSSDLSSICQEDSQLLAPVMRHLKLFESCAIAAPMSGTLWELGWGYPIEYCSVKVVLRLPHWLLPSEGRVGVGPLVYRRMGRVLLCMSRALLRQWLLMLVYEQLWV